VPKQLRWRDLLYVGTTRVKYNCVVIGTAGFFDRSAPAGGVLTVGTA
jgi:ATP-dependent exoDNAse (exonuclease V) beta subunit